MRAPGELREERAVQALTEQLNFYEKGEGAWSALDALARIAHQSSVPLFQSRLDDKDPSLRRAAVEGLARAGDATTVAEVRHRGGPGRRGAGARGDGVRAAQARAPTTLAA